VVEPLVTDWYPLDGRGTGPSCGLDVFLAILMGVLDFEVGLGRETACWRRGLEVSACGGAGVWTTGRWGGGL